MPDVFFHPYLAWFLIAALTAIAGFLAWALIGTARDADDYDDHTGIGS